jgi:hypothetical protein
MAVRLIEPTVKHGQSGTKHFANTRVFLLSLPLAFIFLQTFRLVSLLFTIFLLCGFDGG